MKTILVLALLASTTSALAQATPTMGKASRVAQGPACNALPACVNDSQNVWADICNSWKQRPPGSTGTCFTPENTPAAPPAGYQGGPGGCKC